MIYGLQADIMKQQKSAKWVTTSILAAVVAIALYNAYPGLTDEIWQDEAFTLLRYASGGFWRPFTTYIEPNNHPLFSALLSLWLGVVGQNAGENLLRLLPLGFFLAAVPATFFAGRRLHGTACGLIAALQLAASTVSANHATQLRGYAVSWLPFALMLWCALNINSPQANRWRLGYALSAVFAVAVLPSNLFFSLIVAAAVSVFHLASGMAWNRRNLIGTAILFGSPCFGLLAYAAIWRDVIAAASVDWSGWNRRILFAQWVISTSAEFTIIPVLAMGGFLFALLRALRPNVGQPSTAPYALFALVLPLGMLGLIAGLTQPPFPRTLVPILPVWYCLIGMLAAIAIERIWQRAPRHAVIALCASGLIAALATAYALRTQPCGGIAPRSGEPEQWDLCYQYFRHDYHPARALAAIDRLQAIAPRPVVAHFEGWWPLVRLAQGRYSIMHYRMEFLPLRKMLGDRMPLSFYPIIVANGDKQFRMMTSYLSLDASRYQLVDDGGHFKVYTVRYEDSSNM